MAMSVNDAEKEEPEALFQALSTSPDGLTSSEAQQRFEKYGPNALPEQKVSPLLQFLSYFWGPIPWMIEIAAVLSALVRHWTDFVIIVILLLFNAVVGFWQQHKAEDAVAALKQELALQAQVKRDGTWSLVPAENLVPGDIVRLRLGDIIPADVKLLDGQYLSVDQSALTGESLPVTKKPGDVAFSGSVAKQGEMVALVVATGTGTYFGKTAALVQEAGAVSHFQKAVLQIGDFLIYVSLALVAVLLVVQLFRGSDVVQLVQFALILTVASIPVAMPAVLSVTMAVGAMALSRMKAIVTRLQSLEEMAGIDILCSDKTGTLTQNVLTLGEPLVADGHDESELALAGALASELENQDPIDMAVIGGLKDPGVLKGYTQKAFMPFDPIGKRTEATVVDGSGRSFKVTKGAPQVILGLCRLDEKVQSTVRQQIDELAGKGYRTLGVARTTDGDTWEFLGLLPLSDPPREDSDATIQKVRQEGVAVKMVTGDNLSIAREISRELHLGQNILVADELLKDGVEHISEETARAIEEADGFAQVFPEHKYGIVKALQQRGHLVGMTGDGVNDAPALEQAEVGIAVSGATAAARAAAALVLTAPGLSVIAKAIEEARRIFERMNSYAIYRISETVRIMVFVVATMIAFDFYPITAIMIILLAFFNDVPIMTIAYDHTDVAPNPVRWNMRRVISVASAMGMVGMTGSFLMLLLALKWLKLDTGQVQTFVFLKMAVAGHLALFVARTRGFWLKKPYPAPIVIWSAIATKLAATLLVAYGFGLVTPISWGAIGLIWGYAILFAFVTDAVKMAVYARLDRRDRHSRRFVRNLNRSLFSHVGPHRQRRVGDDRRAA
ncbi:MAG: plasma-membrane proton-efflux P-type ATPase [Gammaproteobacteria bacterium]|nr:plasma-membrane proton-efflux P-type ATPase [Gammaproteobacteria bacterium]